MIARSVDGKTILEVEEGRQTSRLIFVGVVTIELDEEVSNRLLDLRVNQELEVTLPSNIFTLLTGQDHNGQLFLGRVNKEDISVIIRADNYPARYLAKLLIQR